MGVGSGTANVNYTPPNLKGSFLRATGTDPTGKYVGSAINTTQIHSTQTHTHNTITINVSEPYNHGHSLQTYNDDFNNIGGNHNTPPSFSYNDSNNLYTWTSANATTGITCTATIGNTTTSISSTETRPYNYGVNWIIKY